MMTKRMQDTQASHSRLMLHSQFDQKLLMTIVMPIVRARPIMVRNNLRAAA